MKNFIIDEMVIRECDSLKDPNGVETFSSLDFVTSFIESPHKLGINDKIEKKYRNYQDEIKNRGIYSNPTLSAIINKILRSDKIREVDGMPGRFVGPKKCDVQFVGVSIQLNGILVTNDEPLIQSINDHNLQSSFKTVKSVRAKNEL